MKSLLLNQAFVAGIGNIYADESLHIARLHPLRNANTLTENEVAAYSKMANVSEDVLRIIASNRRWMKNYGVVVGLTRNAKTPVAVAMHLMSRLNARDLLTLSVDRNVPEAVRAAARKRVSAGTTRR